MLRSRRAKTALAKRFRFTLTHERLPDGRAKIRILRAVDRAREFVPLRALLRFLRLSPSRFHAWQRPQYTRMNFWSDMLQDIGSGAVFWPQNPHFI